MKKIVIALAIILFAPVIASSFFFEDQEDAPNYVAPRVLSGCNGSDTFTGTDGTGLASHTSDSGNSWEDRDGTAGADIQSNHGHFGVSDFYAFRFNCTPTDADYSVTADVLIANLDNECPGPAVRMQSGVNGDCYWVDYKVAAGVWRLMKLVSSGTRTQITTYIPVGGEIPISANVVTVKLAIVGNAITVDLDGTTRISTTDNSIPAAGLPGIYVDAASALQNGTYIDTYFVTD